MSDMVMRPCAGSWAYCDGMCHICEKANITTSNSTVTTKSNADHIRSLSDEELAELLESLSACSRCRRYGNNCFPVWDALDWLKQPYKEDT